MLKKAFVVVLMGVMLLVLGCNPSPQVSPLNSPVQPAVASPEPTYEAPAPASGKGVITGILNIQNTEQPMANVELYLGTHIGASVDTPMYSLDPSTAPKAMTDENGRFAFKDVDPGFYVIIIWNPFNSFMVRDASTGAELTINLQADQVFDAGVLWESLP